MGFPNYVAMCSPANHENGSNDTGDTEVQQLHDVTFAFSVQFSRFIFEGYFVPQYICVWVQRSTSCVRISCFFLENAHPLYNALISPRESAGRLFLFSTNMRSYTYASFYDLCSYCIVLWNRCATLTFFGLLLQESLIPCTYASFVNIDVNNF